MKGFLILLNLVQFSIILGLTNPDEYRHLEVITKQAQQELHSERPFMERLLGTARTMGHLGGQYHSYYLVSMIRKGSEPVTFGALGQVWLAEELPDWLQSFLKKSE